jgi:predicted enzyme related to lactoylglutathione lyase
MKKVTGIGGIFFKTQDPKAMASWYEKHLDIPFGEKSYSGFNWRNVDAPEQMGHTAFSFFSEDTTYMQPSTKQFMLNFRVENLEALLAQLREEGVTVFDEMESYEFGKFGWILDPEGNKIELWEAVDDKL